MLFTVEVRWQRELPEILTGIIGLGAAVEHGAGVCDWISEILLFAIVSRSFGL